MNPTREPLGIMLIMLPSVTENEGNVSETGQRRGC
jgi:hypothetical protein